MDTVAGERERRSLLPLLLNPVLRTDIVMGKWLAVAAFSCAGLIVTWLHFRSFCRRPPCCLKLPVLFPLALLAAAFDVLISTWCRSIKEAHTYLSFLVFLPMLAGMLAVFVPRAFAAWGWVVPILGQQIALAGQMSPWQACMLFGATVLAAVLALFAAGNRLERDDVVYGS